MLICTALSVLCVQLTLQPVWHLAGPKHKENGPVGYITCCTHRSSSGDLLHVVLDLLAVVPVLDLDDLEVVRGDAVLVQHALEEALMRCN